MIPTPIRETDLCVGDRVCHRKDSGLTGTITHVDDPALSVLVQWDDGGEPDFQWCEKLQPL
jgi:preprotein translocase subunit YajC